MNTTELKKKGINGLLWGGIQYGSVFIIRLILSMILARLLSPRDYGLLGSIMVLVPITTAFIDSGFRQGLIQGKNIVNEDYYTVNTFNISMSILFYLVLFLSMPFISKFYNEPDLVVIGRVIFVSIILGATCIVPDAHLIKHLKIKDSAKIDIISSSVAGVISVGFALLNFGIWALVIRNLLSALIRTILFYRLSRFKPKIKFVKVSFFKLSRFSFALLIAGVIDQIFRNINQIVIGKFYSTYLVGIYDRAKYIYQIPVNIVDQSFKNIAFPIFSSIQDDNEYVLKGLKKILKAYVFILYPILTIAIVLSKSIVIVILSEKWLEVVPLLKVFMVIGYFFPFATLNENVIKAKGRSKVILKNFLIVQSIATMLIYGVVRFDYEVVFLVVVLIIGQILFFYLNSRALNKLISYPLLRQLWDIKLYVFSILVSISITLLIIHQFSVENDFVLFTLGGLCYISYFIICFINKDQITLEIISFIRGKLNGRK